MAFHLSGYKVGHHKIMFSEFNTPPGCTPVNASTCQLPDNPHQSRPKRRSYLVRNFHSRLSSGFFPTHPDPVSGSGIKLSDYFPCQWLAKFCKTTVKFCFALPLFFLNQDTANAMISARVSLSIGSFSIFPLSAGDFSLKID